MPKKRGNSRQTNDDKPVIPNELYDDPSKLFVSGPPNVVRLEGNINNIKKVLYVFFENHSDIRYQTKCTDINSIDTIQYIRKQIKTIKTDAVIDCFLEMDKEQYQSNAKPNNFNDIYLDEFRKFFLKKVNTQEKKDIPVKFAINPKPSMRLHYIDDRDHALMIPIYGTLRQIESVNMYTLNDKNGIQWYKSLFINLLADVTYMLDLLTKQDVERRQNDEHIVEFILKLKDNTTKETKLVFDHFVTRMQTFHKELVKIIKGILDKLDSTEGVPMETKLIEMNVGNIKITNYFPDELPNIIYKLLGEFKFGMELFYAHFTDTYFIKRFISKDYITNALSYTGSFHSTNYIEILVKKFDFKITHASYPKDKDIDKINKIVKQSDNYEIAKLFSPPILIQCSDLTGFPEGFA
jgi:hypothetical protein